MPVNDLLRSIRKAIIAKKKDPERDRPFTEKSQSYNIGIDAALAEIPDPDKEDNILL